ncbi:hypothetical protein AAZX31_01G205700 [Glycine max]
MLLVSNLINAERDININQCFCCGRCLLIVSVSAGKGHHTTPSSPTRRRLSFSHYKSVITTLVLVCSVEFQGAS